MNQPPGLAHIIKVLPGSIFTIMTAQAGKVQGQERAVNIPGNCAAIAAEHVIRPGYRFNTPDMRDSITLAI